MLWPIASNALASNSFHHSPFTVFKFNIHSLRNIVIKVENAIIEIKTRED